MNDSTALLEQLRLLFPDLPENLRFLRLQLEAGKPPSLLVEFLAPVSVEVIPSRAPVTKIMAFDITPKPIHAHTTANS